MNPTPPGTTAILILDLARAGDFAGIREMFTAGLRPLVTAAALQSSWDAEEAQLGSFASSGTPVAEDAGGGGVVVKVPVIFERGELTLVVMLNGAGELVGLQLTPAGDAEPGPAWQPPDYADPDVFEDQEVMLGTGPLAVGGTLSLPLQPGPLPAIVLLGGSGPTDRDGSIGRSKPLKDLAWGLASRGVAVLRFDKVTFAHPDAVRGNADFTVVDEYFPDALAGIRLLEQCPVVDASRIFLGGHSLGGSVAPRITATEPHVAGLVILAGGAQPLHWSTVRQVRYLASLDPAAGAAAQPGIDAMTAQAEAIDSPDLSPGTPREHLLFGVPAPYWLDLRAYDPPAAAAMLGKPMLLCQGGRDYQVTLPDDLSRWRASLEHLPGISIRVYPADNHFFFPGSGPSSPAELVAAAHFDPVVIADIAAWITAG